MQTTFYCIDLHEQFLPKEAEYLSLNIYTSTDKLQRSDV